MAGANRRDISLAPKSTRDTAGVSIEIAETRRERNRAVSLDSRARL